MSEVLFEIGSEPVKRGDLLYVREPHSRRAGAIVTAEFEAEGDSVTVRSPNGAVPTVPITSLSKTYPLPKTPPEVSPRIVKEFEEMVTCMGSRIRQLESGKPRAYIKGWNEAIGAYREKIKSRLKAMKTGAEVGSDISNNPVAYQLADEECGLIAEELKK